MPKVNAGIETSSWILMLAGVAVGVLAWLEADTDAIVYSGIATSVILLGMGAFTAWDAARGAGKSSAWPSGMALLTSTWVVAFPWFVETSEPFLYWSLGIGALAIGASAFDLYSMLKDSTTRPQRPAV